ncbi:hypothetical protein KY289_032064 [Solanum tuberosum]|nr:hypothetical protein KY289_032064 [Solanum tuberosum]
MTTQPQIQSIGITEVSLEVNVCDKIREIVSESPAEFFADNKNIASFDNPGKCLYSTVREHVENALDSAESISELPVVEITIEEIGRSKFNPMIGLGDHERRDEALYDDFKIAKAREKRLANEARVLEIQAKNVALGKKVKDPAATKAVKGREASYYRVTCKSLPLSSLQITKTLLVLTITAIDHIVRGDWFWKSYKFSLQWWSPTSNPIFERPNQVWIRVVGLLLHLWSQKVFREIGNLYGGWIRTEVETELRNHLKWVRLKVQADGESILSTVELTYGDLTFKVQIWVETLARVISDERRRIPINTQRSEDVSSQKGEDSLLG